MLINRSPFEYLFMLLLVTAVSFPKIASCQINSQDSLVLIDILNNNCDGCLLEDASSIYYWDTLVAVNYWEGVFTYQNRIEELHLDEELGLNGHLNIQGGLDSIKVFYLSRNDISKISGLRGLAAISEIRIRDNPNISSIDVNGLDSLSVLSIGHMPLCSFPRIDSCLNLKTLDIQDVYINGMFDFNWCPPNLTSISISSCLIDSLGPIPNQLSSNLISIRFSENLIRTVPSIDRCVNLQSLSLENNMLKSLPPLNDFVYLKSLEVSGNEIAELPPFPSLHKLHIAGNPISNLQHWSFISASPPVEISVGGTNLNFSDLEFFALDTSVTILLGQLNPSRIVEFDSLIFLMSDSTYLDASIAGGTSGIYQWFRDDSLLPNETVSAIVLDSGYRYAKYRSEITSGLIPASTSFPLSTIPVHVFFDEGVSCFDPNCDSVSSILDIIGVGMNYGQTGPKRPFADSLPPGELQPAYDWTDTNNIPLTIQYNGDTINLKHFDSNGDGILDEGDISCFKDNMQPANWAKMGLHRSKYGGTAVKFKAVPQADSIESDTLGNCMVTYRILVDDLEPSISHVNVQGFIIIRPEAQNDAFSIDSMYGDFSQSDFATDTSNLVGLSKFYPNMTLDSNMFANRSCLNEVMNPLEVAVFRKDSAEQLSSNQRMIDCVVIGSIDDLIPLANGNRYIPLVFETTNIVLFEESDNGDWKPHGGSCSVDTIYIKDNRKRRSIDKTPCRSSDVSMELRGGYRTDDIFVDYDLSGEGIYRAWIYDKREILVDSTIGAGASGSFRYSTTSLPKGKYRLVLEACDGSTCQGEFVRKVWFGKPWYFWNRRLQSSCPIPVFSSPKPPLSHDSNCNARMNDLEIKAGYRSQVVYFNYEVSSPDPVRIVIKDKGDSIIHQDTVSGALNTYRYDMGDLKKGKYTVSISTCNGSEFTGEFARKGVFTKPIYYSVFQPSPYQSVP